MDLSRLEPLIGRDNIELLATKKVIVFGLGGVGGYALESLVRSGVSHFIIVDNDKIAPSNINRQIIATSSNIGLSKAQEFKKRILDINQDAEVETIESFVLPENLNEIDFTGVNYIVDCIDTVSTKIALVALAKQLNIPIISALGAGNKLDPTKLEVSDIFKTENDPLAKVLRHELRKRNINKLKVVYSKEVPSSDISSIESGRHSPCSAIFVPASMGLLIGKTVIFDLLNK